MGVSTNAILFYGYCWDDESELLPDEGDSSEWPERVALARGHTNPWLAFPDEEVKKLPYPQQRTASDEWIKQHRAELDVWYEVKRDIEKEFGCEIGRHCSGDCPMPYITIAGSGKTVHRGYPETLTTSNLNISPEWDEMLERFMKELGISPPEGHSPGWWLASYWG